MERSEIRDTSESPALRFAPCGLQDLMPRIITVNDKFQRGYRYTLTASVGRGFDPAFKPELTPAEMLKLGVFGGLYLTDCKREYPKSWFAHAKLSPGQRDNSLNYFGVDASQPLSEWKRKGWLHKDDPRGWFQWYCRYYMGRRHEDDARQIKPHCDKGDFSCRRRQRQALLHWAYDSRKI